MEQRVILCLCRRAYGIGKNDDNWGAGLQGACFSGHIELMINMLSTVETTDANQWNWGLNLACYCGHVETVKLMINPFPTDKIAKGADNLNMGLTGACQGEHKDLAEMMINPGAKYCEWRCNKNHQFSILPSLI